MERTDALKSLCIETAQALKGSARRLCMARTVKALGAGGQRRAARELGWGRMTMRTGTHELASGVTCLEAFAARGRQRVAAHLPHLVPDIRAMGESQSQAAPQVRTNRLSTRVSAAEVRRQRIAHQGDADDALPTVHTITTTRNALGSSPKHVAQSQPPKPSPQPMPSSLTCTRSSRPLMPRTTSDASPWMPKPRAKLGSSRVGARVVPWSRRSIPTFTQRHHAHPSAFSSQRSMHCWCRG